MQAIQQQEWKEDALREALARGLRFLEAAATADGRWLDFRFRFVTGERDVISSQWVTAYVGQAVARAGGSPVLLERARQWLLTHAHPGGGWGFSLSTPPDADSTANVVQFLASQRGDGTGDAALEAACEHLLRYWDEPGAGFRTYLPAERPSLQGWASYPDSSWCDVHLCVTGLAAQALHDVGEPRHKRLLETCARGVRAGQSPEGFWEAYWWHGRTYATFHAARLLHHMGGASASVARALQWVRQGQDANGGWGNGTGGEPAAFHTALALSTLLLDAPRGPRDPAPITSGLQWLFNTQRTDGSWEGTPIMRMPRPEVHAPWMDPEGCLLLPVLRDRNRLFTTATVVSALVDCLAALPSHDNP